MKTLSEELGRLMSEVCGEAWESQPEWSQGVWVRRGQALLDALPSLPGVVVGEAVENVNFVWVVGVPGPGKGVWIPMEKP